MLAMQKEDLWDPPVCVDHPTPEQQQKVKHLLREESGVFACDDSNVGCIPSLQLKYLPQCHTREAHVHVPKPLHKEVKEYLEDLLNKGWLTKSKSPHSLPVVCLHKKDGALCLCCDYQELNKKSIPDRHPIPHIQDMLACLTAWQAAPGFCRGIQLTSHHLHNIWDYMNERGSLLDCQMHLPNFK